MDFFQRGPDLTNFDKILNKNHIRHIILRNVPLDKYEKNPRIINDIVKSIGCAESADRFKPLGLFKKIHKSIIFGF